MNARGVLAAMAAAGLAGCGQQSPPAPSVDVSQLRGATIQPLQAQPVLEEVPPAIPEAPLAGKPQVAEVAKLKAGARYWQNFAKLQTSLPVTAQSPQAGRPAEPPSNAVDPTPQVIDGYRVVDFKQLTKYIFKVPDDPVTEPAAKEMLGENEIPEDVQALNKQKIALKGYMLPLRTEDGKVVEFLVMANQALCCFGAVPKITEYVSVRMPEGRGVNELKDIPITVFGTFKVGAIVENDYVVGLYEMTGHTLNGPIDL